MLPMFFVMTGVYFMLQNYLPGGPVQDMLQRLRGSGDGGSASSMTMDDMAKLKADLERQYGLDKPVPVRYWIWLGKITRLEFGDSTVTRRPALQVLVERIPISLGFGIPGFFLTYLVCIVLGVLKALKDGQPLDLASSSILFVAYSIPPLVISVIALLVFCTDRVLPTAWFPLGGAYSDGFDTFTSWQKIKDYVWHMFLPVCASLLGSFTLLTMLMKNSMLDVLRSDYIRTAHAKGLSDQIVVFKHALRNALLPLMVGMGGILSAFVAGSIIIESVFGLPGMGILIIESLTSRDYNVLMAVAVIQSMVIMLGQLISDITYFLVDPRIEFK